MPLEKPYENTALISSIGDNLSLRYENTHKVLTATKDSYQHIEKNFETYKTIKNKSEVILMNKCKININTPTPTSTPTSTTTLIY